MIELVEVLQRYEIIRFRQEFLDAIGMKKQGFKNITDGGQHFRIDHIERACDAYNVNANWLFGKEENVFRMPLTVLLPAANNQGADGTK